MSYHSLILLALYFKRWNQNPPYLYKYNAHNVLECECESSSCVPKKLKPLLSFKGQYLIPSNSSPKAIISPLKSKGWSNESFLPIGLLSLYVFGRWPIWPPISLRVVHMWWWFLFLFLFFLGGWRMTLLLWKDNLQLKPGFKPSLEPCLIFGYLPNTSWCLDHNQPFLYWRYIDMLSKNQFLNLKKKKILEFVSH